MLTTVPTRNRDTARRRAETGALGTVLGLYLGRVLAETSAQPWSLPQLGPLVVICLLAGLAIVALGLRHRSHRRSLFVLIVYVLWPTASASAALGVLLVTATVTVMANVRSVRGVWPEIAVLFAALALYVVTLAPGLLPADAGEFQLASAVLGIAHPPGYALYTILGKAITLLVPVSDAAWRVNLLSALCAAGTLFVLTRTVRRQSGSAAAAVVTSAALGLSATFWAQATTANIRALTALAVAALIGVALRWSRERSPRLLWMLALTFGLAVGHHASLAPLGLPLAAYVLVTEPGLLRQPRRWLAPLAALAASFLVLLYLPIRSALGAPFDTSPIRSVSGFFEHVLATGFRGDMFYYRTWPDLLARVDVWADILRLQFGPVLLVGALGGSAVVAWRDRRAFLLLAGIGLVNTVLAITYRAPQTVEYLLPSYVALTALLGYGLGLALPLLHHPAIQGLVIAAVLGPALANGRANAPSMWLLHRDDSTRTAAAALLADAPEGAAILANWHRATPLWYLQIVEGLRRDVEVIYVYPEGDTPNEEVWLRRIAEESARRPVIVTNRFYAYETSGTRLVPLHDAWLAVTGPLLAPPEQITTREAAFGDGITLLGYRLPSAVLHPGSTLELRVYWRVERALERDYSTFAQLVGQGGVLGQGDLQHRSTTYLPGEVRVDAYSIPVLLHAPPGPCSLITGFYSPEGDSWTRLPAGSADHVVLAEIEVAPNAETFASTRPRADRYAGALQLSGADVDRSVAGQVRLYLHLQRGASLYATWAPWRAEGGTVRLTLTGAEGVAAEAAVPALAPGTAATVAVDLPADLESVRLTITSADGAPQARLGPWHRPIAREVTIDLASGAQQYVPLGGEMVFTGLVRQPAEVAAGDRVALCPQFLALRPLTHDYSVSIGLASLCAGWEVKTDGTPALGAIPTLKWLRGWTVTDPHTLTLDQGAPRGPAQVTLTVYNAFTLQPLNVLDERLVREGQGTSLLSGETVLVR